MWLRVSSWTYCPSAKFLACVCTKVMMRFYSRIRAHVARTVCHQPSQKLRNLPDRDPRPGLPGQHRRPSGDARQLQPYAQPVPGPLPRLRHRQPRRRPAPQRHQLVLHPAGIAVQSDPSPPLGRPPRGGSTRASSGPIGCRRQRRRPRPPPSGRPTRNGPWRRSRWPRPSGWRPCGAAAWAPSWAGTSYVARDGIVGYFFELARYVYKQEIELHNGYINLIRMLCYL